MIKVFIIGMSVVTSMIFPAAPTVPQNVRADSPTVIAQIELEKPVIEAIKEKPVEAKPVEPLPEPVPEPVVSKPIATGGSCVDWMAQAGIPLTHATQKLIINESGCRVNAINPKSGACGIPQAWPCSKLPCTLDNAGAVCQLQWMDQYVKGRYGTWENALSTWYSRCGSPQGCWY